MWHGVTFVVVVAALVLQTVLVLQGGRVLDETAIPPLGTRLLRLVSYFTIQSNVLVAVVTGMLTLDPARDGRWFRVLRLDAVVAIAVTGLVHLVLLAPLLDLHGVDAVADTLLHKVVPLLAVTGWLVFGPRPRVARRTVGLALIWPVAWLVYTLLMGQVNGWYPYPFVDVGQLGLGRVLLNCAGVTVLFLALFALVALVDRRLAPAPERPDHGTARSADAETAPRRR